MSSYFYGKPEICAWIRKWFPREAEILDVGACDGLWRRLLPDFPNMDAVEAFHDNAMRLEGYREIFCAYFGWLRREGLIDIDPCTNLNKRGMPVQEIAAILGHEKIDTTMKYINLDHQIIKASYHRYT